MNIEKLPEKIARRIVQRGAGTLLPWDIGDASVSFSSRLELARWIAEAIEDVAASPEDYGWARHNDRT